MKKKFFEVLKKTKYGHLTMQIPTGKTIELGCKESNGVEADIQIHDWSMIDLVLSKGDIGFGEAYIKEFYTTTNIVNLLLFFLLNVKEFESLFNSNLLFSKIFALKNFCKKNSLKRSKKNIEFHYDLGNDFYSLWLDETMSYSSGLFMENDSLLQSQKNKYQRIIKQLNHKNPDVLEIGSGWGGFISEANQQGFEIKGLTLSNEQKSYCDELINKNSINAKVIVQDYRLENKKFENIVSIEMFEAVGRKYWETYFSQIKSCLKKGGKAVIQTITIGNEYYKTYEKTSDFIREYIFPGGFLPSPTIFRKIANKHGLNIIDEFNFGESYDKTLMIWLNNFNKIEDKVKKKYNSEFINKWRFYLAYCVAGFRTKRTDVIQFSLTH